MLLLFFSRCKKQTPDPGVCSQQDSVLYAFEHLQYSISGFAPKEQNCANVVTIWTDELLPKIQKAVQRRYRALTPERSHSGMSRYSPRISSRSNFCTGEKSGISSCPNRDCVPVIRRRVSGFRQTHLCWHFIKSKRYQRLKHLSTTAIWMKKTRDCCWAFWRRTDGENQSMTAFLRLTARRERNCSVRRVCA